MMNLKMRLAALAAAGGLAAIVPAAVPASAAAHSAAVTGPEVISGTVYGRAPDVLLTHIPVTLHGIVNTRAPGISLEPQNATTRTFETAAGTLILRNTGKVVTTSTSTNAKTCQSWYRESQPFKVWSGRSTGAFAGAYGPGVVQAYFAVVSARYTSGSDKGKCDLMRPVNQDTVLRILGTIKLTVKK